MSGVVTASLLPEERPRQAPEEALHRSVVTYLKWALPPDATYYHPANGGLRSKVAAQKLVGLGVRAGIPDIAIVWAGRAVFIELKAQRGSISEAQKQMHKKLIFCGAHVLICKTLEGVENSLRELGIPLHARVS